MILRSATIGGHARAGSALPRFRVERTFHAAIQHAHALKARTHNRKIICSVHSASTFEQPAAELQHRVNITDDQCPVHTKSWISRVPAALAVLASIVALSALVPDVAAAAASTTSSSNPISGIISFILHLDHHMSAMITEHGQLTYVILWTIVFCETGLVLTPFLPGDSLLFAAGAFAGLGKLSLGTLMAVFLSSAILGDAVNYAIGNKLGKWAMQKGIIQQAYITKTEKFYEKYGGKTVVLARFVPIVRTFAPFVAGVGSMPYGRFAMYNVVGAIVWAVLFVGGGYFFGNLPFVQKNFTAVVLAIVAVSVVPVIIELINARKEGQEPSGEQGGRPGSASA
mmetsp:Transcript_39757/g.88369  ORF Transcript_39757/g.88369 Transcript_39757/m.88369 type:complete len:341 (+) Transcript_39757:27-1049(+)